MRGKNNKTGEVRNSGEEERRMQSMDGNNGGKVRKKGHGEESKRERGNDGLRKK